MCRYLKNRPLLVEELCVAGFTGSLDPFTLPGGKECKDCCLLPFDAMSAWHWFPQAYGLDFNELWGFCTQGMSLQAISIIYFLVEE